MLGRASGVGVLSVLPKRVRTKRYARTKTKIIKIIHAHIITSRGKGDPQIRPRHDARKQGVREHNTS